MSIEKRKRNQKILSEYQLGASLRTLSEKFDVSYQRVHAIIKSLDPQSIRPRGENRGRGKRGNANRTNKTDENGAIL